MNLLLVAHGTQSLAGRTSTERIMSRVRRLRPSLLVDLCYLDVLTPSLASWPFTQRCVVVPMLLSTGYHVTVDIPELVGSRAVIAGYLGPSPALVEVVAARLAAARGPRPPASSIALVAAGSSQPAAAHDLGAAASLLAGATGQSVTPLTLNDPSLRSKLASFGEIATYLLVEGLFHEALLDHAVAVGIDVVGDVIGDDPAVASLILDRYDEALASVR